MCGGKAEGILCGGNLSLIDKSLGTPYSINTEGKLLFIEEVHEEPYKVDGMLTHLRNSGALAKAAGIILGAFTDAEAKEPEPEFSLTMEEVFDELIRPLGIPAVTGFTCGHTMPTMSLPLGRKMRLDADTGELTDIE
jgi:muramoyltetrapeptide carboxypeptidase